MSASDSDVTLIVGTVDRTAELERLLTSVASQGEVACDVIVVDQNPDDRLGPVLARFGDRLKIRRLLTARRGLSRARNLGLREPGAPVVAFPDDDCVYPEGLLRRALARLRDRSDLVGVTGRLVDFEGRQSLGRFDAAAGPVTRWNAWRRCNSSTLFLCRAAVLAAGGFDEDLGLGSDGPWQGGEDVELPIRLLRRGGRLTYDPDLAVRHPPRSDDAAGAAARAHMYGLGIGAVWRKHRFPHWFAHYHILRALAGSVLGAVRLRPDLARTHLAAFRGRWAGWSHPHPAVGS